MIFCLLSTILISALLVILVKNPIHSILYLVLVFFQTTMLLILLDAEVLALIFLIVYIGAISILFLFIVMMLNIKIIEINEVFFRYLPLAGILGISFFMEVLIILDINTYWVNKELTSQSVSQIINNLNNLEVLGLVIYTYYILYFLIASLLLMVAIIGAIALTLRKGSFTKRQEAIDQVNKKLTTITNYITLVEFRNIIIKKRPLGEKPLVEKQKPLDGPLIEFRTVYLEGDKLYWVVRKNIRLF